MILLLIIFVQLCLYVDSTSPQQEWANWKLKYDKKYSNPEAEEKARRTFIAQLQRIKNHNNNPGETYKLKVNEFSDVPPGEFIQRNKVRPSQRLIPVKKQKRTIDAGEDCGNAFTCANGIQCVPYGQYGDGFCDCSDGSDEMPGYCTPGSTCPQLTCKGSNICYGPTKLNDGVCDCPQGDDEPDTDACKLQPQPTQETTTAPTGESRRPTEPCDNAFTCLNGDCVSWSSFGDGFCDCIDGSDEMPGYCTPGSTCPQLTCKGSNICYGPTKLNDGVCDCPQGDDEPDTDACSHLPPSSITPTPTPPPSPSTTGTPTPQPTFSGGNLTSCGNSINWVELGKVTSVRNQGACGSCSYFAAMAAIESQFLINGHGTTATVDYSEQQLMDCSFNISTFWVDDLVTIDGIEYYYDCTGSNQYCNGGWATCSWIALKRLVREERVYTEASYPYREFYYTGNQPDPITCQYPEPSTNFVNYFFDLKWYWEKPIDYDENKIMELLCKGPVAVTLFASDPKFQSYSSGIYSPSDEVCAKWIDHQVVIVGFGTDPELGDYFLVKNSWGDWWGENGYFRYKRGNNKCIFNYFSEITYLR